MSLQGSLETVALPEVLHLLADTRKTGELTVTGDGTAGSVWFDNGELAGHDVDRSHDTADALFMLLRVRSGRFSFDAGVEGPPDATREELGPPLDAAQARFAEWSDIITVVPSLDHVAALAESGPSGEVTLQPDQWALCVAVGEGRTVREVLDRRDLPEFDGCKSLRNLVDIGLVEISEPAPVPVPFVVVEAVYEVAAEPVADAVPQDETQDAYAVEAEDIYSGAEDADGPAVTATGDVEFSVNGFPTFGAHPVSEAVDTTEDQNVASADDSDSDDSDSDDSDSDDSDSDGSDSDPDYRDTAERIANSRSMLDALVAEVAASEAAHDQDADDADHADAHDGDLDGLADRGPWSSSELASLEHVDGGEFDADVDQVHSNGHSEHVEDDDDRDVASAFAAQVETYRGVQPHDEVEEPEAPVEDVDSEQDAPINRGLLLKFLSSVRS